MSRITRMQWVDDELSHPALENRTQSTSPASAPIRDIRVPRFCFVERPETDG
jgi:hypothetical protein